MDLALTAEAIATESVSDNGDDDGRERADLELAIASLRSKLETLQPEGTKPSDIAAAAQAPVQIGGGVDANTASIREADEGTAENEVVLSQTVTSQRSILLWDEILTVVEAMNSPRSQVQAMAYTAVSELGMDNLEDGVLHRLCVNEIFTQEDYGDDYEIAVEASERAVEASLDRTKSSQLSYQVSLSLYRILFCQKVLYLKAIPSRLLLDAILQAGKAHGRAIVDSVLLPAIRDYVGFSKLTSELVQKVMKEQTSATVIHFLRLLQYALSTPNSTVDSL
ncbi:hypothetical protein BGZ58_010981 [Dissophora ornata]|nr:hypothetical protein BGZ58_010981 [Dissophora ornata]